MKRKLTYLRTKALLCVFVFLSIAVVPCRTVLAQTSADYTFATNSVGSLILDINSNPVDMSTGTTQLVGPGLDAAQSPVTAIGFSFTLMGAPFTQFSVNDDGQVRLGSTAVGVNSYTLTGGTTAAPKLSAFNADMRTGTTTGKIHYKLHGTSPSQVLVIEFIDMQLFYTAAAAAGTSTWQVRLYESGVIEYVYGAMSATSVASTSKSPSIGFYKGSATANFASVLYATHTVSTTSPYAANPAVSAVGPIANLTSSVDGSRRVYTFTPPVACSAAPAIGQTTASVANACVGSAFTLGVTGVTAATGYSYQFESSPAGTNTWAGLGTASSANTYSVASQAAPTDYRVIVTCTNSSQSTTATMVNVSQNPFYNCYCTPVSNCTNEGIENVTFSTINNTSTFCTSTSGYTSYNGLGSLATVNQGDLVPISVTAHINSNPASAGVWIDYNQNAAFEASEYTSLGSATVTIPTGGTTNIFTGNVPIDVTAITGITRMRVRSANQSGITNTSSCITTGGFGEFEDYLITINAGSACTGTPVGGTAVASVNTVACGTAPVTLSATGYSAGVIGLTFQWQESTNGVNYTDIGPATPNYANYTLSGLSQNMSYRLQVSCGTGGGQGWSNAVSVTFASAPIPWTEGFETVTAPGANIFPSCWTRELITGTNSPGTTTTSDAYRNPRTGTRYLYSQYNTTAWVYTPGFDLLAGVSYDFSFYMMNKTVTSPVNFTMDVAYGTAPASASMTNVLQAGYVPSNNTYQLFSYTFTPPANGTYNFGIKSTSPNTTPWYLSYDDFKLEVTPTCAAPVVTAATNITTSTATINWNPSISSPTSGYDYYYSTNNTAPTAATTPSGSVLAGVTTENLSGLAASTTYYVWVRSNCGGSLYSSWNGSSFQTLLGNDLPAGATSLTVGAACTGAAYTNVGGTFSTGEPSISCRGTSITNGAAVWFKFVAPASGFVRVSTDFSGGVLTDTKLGLFTTSNPTDPTDLASFSIIGCDDDNGVTSGLTSALYASGLTGGATYYVAVDHYNGTGTGTFCLQVDDVTPAMISPAGACLASGETPYSREDYTGWATIVDGQGRLISNVRRLTAGATNTVYNYTASLNVNTAPVRQYGTKYYLDRNYRMIYAGTTTSTFDVKLYFLNTELAALQLVDPSATLLNLNVTHQTGSACVADYNPASGTNSALLQAANGTANGISYIQVNTPGFSNFYVMSDIYPLTIKLEDISAVNVGSRNRVDWKTASEETGDYFELERSSDGKLFSKLGTVTANGHRSAYSYWDETPIPGVNYYRLRMVDATGKFAHSKIVSANIKGGGFVVEAYPNPVSDALTVKAYGTPGSNATVIVTDVTGKVVRTANITKGVAEIDMHGLAQGMYLVKYTDNMHSETIKVNKQ